MKYYSKLLSKIRKSKANIGIIGLGRIGGRFAQMLAPWRVRIIAYDPYQPIDRFIHANVQRVDLETLLMESDVVSLHVVLNTETYHMMSDREFGLMKPSAVFLNTSGCTMPHPNISSQPVFLQIPIACFFQYALTDRLKYQSCRF